MVDLKLAEQYSDVITQIEKLTAKKEELGAQLLAQMGTDPIVTLDRRITKVIKRDYPLKKYVTVEWVQEHYPDAIKQSKPSINKEVLENDPTARELFETTPKETVYIMTKAL